MYKKKLVYVLTAFFTEESGLEGSEEYYADSYQDIEKVKQQIYEDYPDEIDQIVVSDGMQGREFYT